MKTNTENKDLLEETKLAMKVIRIATAITLFLIIIAYLVVNTPNEKLINLFSFLTVGSFIVAFGMLASYGAKFVDKNWRRNTMSCTRKRLAVKMLFCLWLMITVFCGNCGHQRQIEGIKQEQKQFIASFKGKVTKQEQQIEEQRPYVEEYWRLLERESEVLKIVGSKRFLYLPSARLKNIREVLEGR